ncbi:hypothetical protein, partial [Enterobacter hormaechei]
SQLVVKIGVAKTGVTIDSVLRSLSVTGLLLITIVETGYPSLWIFILPVLNIASRLNRLRHRDGSC